jgi:CHAT domain-containing protein
LSTTPLVQELLQRLNFQWDRCAAGRPFVERHLQWLELATRRLLKTLYDELIARVEISLAEQLTPDMAECKLAIIPHGLLHQVPFQALHNGESYLLERYSISYAPSATAWALCQKRSARHQGNALVLGVADASLPAVEAEVKAVARQLQEAEYAVDLRLNERATLTTLPTSVSICHILHIACHGLFRADNPMFSALKLHDGWFTATDAMQLDLTGALVTLSACESGRSRVVIGDEIVGLIRAFLGAGAATLVVSQWLVQDEAAALLMATWYEQLKASSDKAAALRAAQLATKAHYPHPYYWAPFILVGQR